MGLVPSPTLLSIDEMGRIAPPIFTSVGRRRCECAGRCFRRSVVAERPAARPHSPVPVTGVADTGTTLAIEAYQAVVMQMMPPSGRVDPGSATYYSLAAARGRKRAAAHGRTFR